MLHPMLTALFTFLIVRGAALLFRDRRPSRFALLVFWGLLLAAHLTGYPEFLPAIAASLVVALWLRWRDPSAALEGPGRPRRPHGVIVDLDDQQPGEQKGGRARSVWHPTWRDAILVVATAILSSAATFLHFAPLMLQVKSFEEERLVPQVHVDAVESPSEREGEMDFTIHAANLGPRAVDLFIAAQPMQDWVGFTARTAVKVVPDRPIESGVGRDRATVRFKLEAGRNASVTFTAIRFSPTKYGYGAHGMHAFLYADNREQWLKFYTSMRPRTEKPAGGP